LTEFFFGILRQNFDRMDKFGHKE